MYCKHCGKEIADDSKFCRHCGGMQDDSTTTNQRQETSDVENKENVVEIPTIRTNLSDTTKWWIIGCGIWVVLNLYWLFAGDKYDSAGKHFMPFYTEGLDDSGSYYDISEFVVYVIGLPFVCWGLAMLNKTINDTAESGTQQPPQQIVTKEDNDINDALGL